MTEVLEAKLVLLVLTEPLVLKVPVVQVANAVLWVLKVVLANKDLRDPLVNRVTQVLLVKLEKLVPRALLVNVVLQVQWVPWVPPALEVNVDPLVMLVQTVRLASAVKKVKWEKLELLV